MKRIVFQTNQLSVRGTEIALYDYAYYTQSILNHRAIIAYKNDSIGNNPHVINKFSREFELIPYKNLADLDSCILLNQVDLMYSIKAGEPDGIISSSVPTMVHAVFPQHPSSAHGSSYAFVSDWLSRVCSRRVIPAVPHIVTLPDVDGNLRLDLGIPADATVFGCYGGATSFDINFAKKAVIDIVDKKNNIYFIFMNIEPFFKHSQIMFLPSSADLIRKVKFINTCDAMLHARKLGESFGLACAEFSVKNKPIFTYSKSPQRHHLEVLGKKAFLYSGYKSLMSALLNFDSAASSSQLWDCYSEKFSPKNVMELFDKHLIQVAETNGIVSNPRFHLGLRDHLGCQYENLKLRGIKFSRLWAN